MIDRGLRAPRARDRRLTNWPAGRLALAAGRIFQRPSGAVGPARQAKKVAPSSCGEVS